MVDPSDKELDDSVDAFVDALMEGTEEVYDDKLEPYEVHVQKIRNEIHADINDFTGSFIAGYEILLEELTQQYRGEILTEDKIPPGAIRL